MRKTEQIVKRKTEKNKHGVVDGNIRNSLAEEVWAHHYQIKGIIDGTIDIEHTGEFGDGTETNTQATRAEDIISEKDKEQDVIIKGLADAIGDAGEWVGDVAKVYVDEQDKLVLNNAKEYTDEVAALKADITYVDQQDALKVDITDFEADQERQDNESELWNTTQDQRIEVLEAAAVGSTSDFGVLQIKDVNVSGVYTNLKGTITTDFQHDNIQIFDQTFDDKTVVETFKPLLGEVDFELVCNKGDLDKPTLVIEVVELDSGTILEQDEIPLDFTISETQLVVKGFVGRFRASRFFTRVKILETGNMTLPSGTITIKNNVEGGAGEVYDYNVLSTSSTVDGNNVKENIDSLKTEIDSNAVNIAGNASDIANNAAAIAVNETSLDDLLNGSNLSTILDTLVPIGTIQLGTAAPTYGTWQDLGAIADGQTIIGGASSNGEVISHNHSIKDPGHKHGYVNGGAYRDGRGGNDKWVNTKNVDTDRATTGITINNTGGDHNKAWGLGLGTGVHVWKRTA